MAPISILLAHFGTTVVAWFCQAPKPMFWKWKGPGYISKKISCPRRAEKKISCPRRAKKKYPVPGVWQYLQSGKSKKNFCVHRMRKKIFWDQALLIKSIRDEAVLFKKSGTGGKNYTPWISNDPPLKESWILFLWSLVVNEVFMLYGLDIIEGILTYRHLMFFGRGLIK